MPGSSKDITVLPGAKLTTANIGHYLTEISSQLEGVVAVVFSTKGHHMVMATEGMEARDAAYAAVVLLHEPLGEEE